MTRAENLLRHLYNTLKEYDSANNEFRRNPSDKTFSDYEKKERNLMITEQKVRDYLIEHNIEIKSDKLHEED
jgi:hypothetical protein